MMSENGSMPMSNEEAAKQREYLEQMRASWKLLSLRQRNALGAIMIQTARANEMTREFLGDILFNKTV